MKNTKKDLENLEKTLKNAPKIAGNPGHKQKLENITMHVRTGEIPTPYYAKCARSLSIYF